jgi:hypothetical protein
LLRHGAVGGDPSAAYAGIARISPADVAGRVVDAIRRDRFWIHTHPACMGVIEHRPRGILGTDELAAPPFL